MPNNVKTNDSKDRIKPIRITDDLTGEEYELDFTRESVKFAEERNFEIENVLRFPVTNLPFLFFLSFRAHHKSVSKQKADALFDRLGGLSPAFIERLIFLYGQAQQSNNIVDNDEDMGKNGNLTVAL